MTIPCKTLCLSQSSAGCHLRRATSWRTAVLLPMEEQQSPSQALSTVQEWEASRAQLATEPGEPHWPVLSLISWHTSGGSRLITNSSSNNEGSRTIKPTQTRNSSQCGEVGAVSLSHSLHKVSRCLCCASSCITTLPLPLLLPSSDPSRCSQAKPGPGPRPYSAWAELKSKTATDKKSEWCGVLA